MLTREIYNYLFIIGLIAGVLIPLCTVGQTSVYPVQVNTVIQPPYTLNLNDYKQPGKFYAQVFLADRNRQELEVYLKLTIKGPNNLVISTSNPAAGETITLSGGGIKTITSDEYSYLFETQNLTFTNILPGQAFPEGFYIFNLEIIEKRTGIAVSNAFAGGFSVMIVKNDPPFLNLPQNQKTYTVSIPQPLINFSWTPRHMSLNSSFNTQYRLVVVRKPNLDMADYQALLTQPPLVDITTRSTSYMWNMNDPLLITDPLAALTAGAALSQGGIVEGVYAWQVQAIDVNNGDQFKNGGWSEAYSFTYAAPCDLPALQEAILQPDNSVRLDLIANAAHTANEVYVKELGASSFVQRVNAAESSLLIDDLNPSTTYELHARAQCGQFWTTKRYLASITTTGNNVLACVAPTTLEVKDGTNPEELILTWNESNQGGQYRLYIQKTGVSPTTVDVALASHTLAVAPNDYPIEVRVDALCGANTDLGTNVQITATTRGFIGDCSFPDRNGFKIDGSGALTWAVLTEHEGFELRYKKSSEAIWQPQPPMTALSKPEYLISDITLGEQYDYQLKYNCASGTTDWSETKTFLLDQRNNLTNTNTETGGTCMPPKAILHELNSETSIDIRWDKMSGIKSYELIYKIDGSSSWITVAVSGTAYTLENLTPNTAYIYQIRSECTDGESILSDEKRFSTADPLPFSDDCPKVLDLHASDTSMTQITTAWTEADIQHSYIVYYKQENQSISNWYQRQVADPTALIDHLKPGTTYEIKVQSTCGTDKGKTSDIIKVTTLPDDAVRDDSFACGESTDACDRSNTTPATTFVSGDEVYAHDFVMVLGDVQLQGSSYTGDASIVVPYFNGSSVNVSLENAQFNELGCLIAGRMITTGMTLQVLPDAVRTKINGALDQIDAAFDLVNSTLDQASTYLAQIEDLAKSITEPVDLSAYDNMTPQEMFEEGKKIYAEAKQLYDDYKAGNIANADIGKILKDLKTGVELIKKAIALGAGVVHQLDQLDNLDAKADYKVTFSPTSGNQNSFDAYNGREFAAFYQQMGTAEEGVKYFVPYMAIDEGQTKKVIADVTIPDFDKTKLSFITNSIAGQNLQVLQPDKLNYTELSATRFEITVPADVERVYAMYKTTDGLNHRMAKLNVVETKPISKKVIIVPNTTSHALNATTIKNTLNQVFDVPNVTFTVEVKPAYTATAWDESNDGLLVDDHKFMSRYSSEMEALEEAYFAQTGITRDPAAVYLFIVHSMKNSDGTNVLGYMPRNKSVGFLASSPSTNTVAHELGHGLFRLAHTWHLDENQAQGSTNNLMDYNNGTVLLGAQWQQIQDPSFEIYGLDQAEDGAAFRKSRFCTIINSVTESNVLLTDLEIKTTIDRAIEYGANENNSPSLPFIKYYEYTTYEVSQRTTDEEIQRIRWYLLKLYCELDKRVGVKIYKSQDGLDYANILIPHVGLDRQVFDYTIWISDDGDVTVVDAAGNEIISVLTIGFNILKGGGIDSKYKIGCAVVNMLRQIVTQENPNSGLIFNAYKSCWDGVITMRHAPCITISVDRTIINEKNESVTITATASEAVQNNVIVKLEYFGDAIRSSDQNASHLNRIDYIAQNSIVISSGQQSSSITLRTLEDGWIEQNEEIKIKIDEIEGRGVDCMNYQNLTIVIDEHPTPTLATLENVRTYIDENNNAKVVWRSNGVIQKFKWKKTTSTNFDDTLIPVCQNNTCYVDIPSKIGRLEEFEYEIKTQDDVNERGFKEVLSITGAFQGPDHIKDLCDGEFGPIGVVQTRFSDATYLWTQQTGVADNSFIENNTKATFNFKYIGKHNYQIKRIHGGIEDYAIVVIDPIINCDWQLKAIDLTTIGGAREALTGETLQVVIKSGQPRPDVKVKIFDNDGVKNVYEENTPRWTKDNNIISTNGMVPKLEDVVTYGSFNYPKSIPNDPSVDKDEYDVEALKRHENVTVEYFQPNAVSTTTDDFFNYPEMKPLEKLSNGCMVIDKINTTISSKIAPYETEINDLIDIVNLFRAIKLEDKIEHVDINKPFNVACDIKIDVKKVNEEVLNSPNVVRDEYGNYIINTEGEFKLPVGPVTISYEAKPIKFYFDRNLRKEQELEFKIQDSITHDFKVLVDVWSVGLASIAVGIDVEIDFTSYPYSHNSGCALGAKLKFAPACEPDLAGVSYTDEATKKAFETMKTSIDDFLKNNLQFAEYEQCFIEK